MSTTVDKDLMCRTIVAALYNIGRVPENAEGLTGPILRTYKQRMKSKKEYLERDYGLALRILEDKEQN